MDATDSKYNSLTEPGRWQNDTGDDDNIIAMQAFQTMQAKMHVKISALEKIRKPGGRRRGLRQTPYFD